MGVSTFAQQWMMPKAGDPNQQKMMMWMPIFFTVLFIAPPGRVVPLITLPPTYWVYFEQFFLNRKLQNSTPQIRRSMSEPNQRSR